MRVQWQVAVSAGLEEAIAPRKKSKRELRESLVVWRELRAVFFSSAFEATRCLSPFGSLVNLLFSISCERW